MAGSPHGVHSSYYAAPVAPNADVKDIAALYSSITTALDYLVAMGVCSKIARFDGDAHALGINRNNFSVYRWASNLSRTYDWYLLVQMSHSNANVAADYWGGNGNGSPASLNNSLTTGGVGFQVAVAIDSFGGSTSPWLGGIANDGTDAKTSPVWTKPAGGKLFVWGSRNSDNGSRAALKEDCMVFGTSYGNTASRLHVLADSDCLALYRVCNSQGVIIIAPVIPITNLVMDVPLAVLSSYTALATQILGDTLNGVMYGCLSTGQNKDGGISIQSRSDVQPMEYNNSVLDGTASYFPNKQYSPTRYSEFPIFLYGSNSGGTTNYQYNGCVGYFDSTFVMQTYNIAYNSTLNSLSRVVFGSSVTASPKLTFPWDSATADPTAGVTLEGVSF